MIQLSSAIRTVLLRSVVTGLMLITVITASSVAVAIEVVAVEEYWELKIGEPDQAVSGPQITMIMSPTYDLQADYFLFTLNHHTAPSFSPGGMQVQHWYDEQLEYSKLGPDEGMLSHENETVSWMQRMTLSDGDLTYEVVGGSSQSWGSFGDAGELRVTTPSTLDNLNDYRAAISIGDSGVGFGGNRVESLILKRLRWIDDQGNLYELEAPIDVDTDLDP